MFIKAKLQLRIHKGRVYSPTLEVNVNFNLFDDLKSHTLNSDYGSRSISTVSPVFINTLITRLLR